MKIQPGDMGRNEAMGDSVPAVVQPTEMTHAEMDASYDRGHAEPLGNAIPWLMRYKESWWVLFERGWLRVTDKATAAEISEVAERLRVVDEQEIRKTVSREDPSVETAE